jgi:hypothetical protein
VIVTDPFDAEQFVRDLDAGAYDTDIWSEINYLNIEQLREVAEELIRMRQEQSFAAER